MREFIVLPKNRKHFYTTLFLVLIFIICFFEGFLHRNFDYLFTACIRDSSLTQSLSYYPHGYMFDDDVGNHKLHAEGYALAINTYKMATIFKKKSNLSKLSAQYTPDKYRVFPSFLASFLLYFLSLNNAYFIINLLCWMLVAFSIWWLGKRIFNSMIIGFIAAFLCATSYTMIIFSSGVKAEIFQLSFYVILIALALFLEHFSDDISKQGLINSFLLGIFSGLGIFAGGATVYFIPFLIFYGLMVMNFKKFLIRNLFLVIGCLLVYFSINSFIDQGKSASVLSWIFGHGFNLSKWFYTFKSRILNHFIFLIPLPLWFGAIFGLFMLKVKESKIILCIASVFIASEIIMCGANPYQWYTPAAYYLQLIFPIYFLNARFIYFLILERRNNSKSFLIFIKRVLAAIFILLILFMSNIRLIGNKYFFYNALSPIPVEIFHHSYFTFDNIYLYEKVSKEKL
ncbi:MAG: hypothetical protein AB1755_02510 [Candidatus Omnitrophota bacterium]